METARPPEPGWPDSNARAGKSVSGQLGHAHLLCLQTFGPTLDDKRHTCTFVEGAIPARLDGGKMDENILAILTLDKTKSFGRIKPLNRTGFFHVSLFPSL